MSYAKTSDYPCFICGKIYHTKDYLLLHTKIHAGVKPFTCENCPKSFPNITALKNHMQIHSDASHMCPMCGLYLKTKKSLKIHIINHSRDTDIKIEHSKELIATAVQKVLNGSAVLKVAEALNVSYGSLTRWVNMAKQQNSCNICGKSFSFKSELDKHLESKHVENKKPLTEKGRKFDKEFKATVLEYLKTNSKTATIEKFKISESTLRGWSLMAKKPLCCPTCDFTAPSKSKFERHMCRFADEQTHPCPLCDLNLTSRQMLKKHMTKVHNQQESNGNRNDLREFLQNLNPAELGKIDAKHSEDQISPKTAEQTIALNNILKGYTRIHLTNILKRIQSMNEQDIAQFLESHAKPKPLTKEIKLKPKSLTKEIKLEKSSAADVTEDSELGDLNWDFKELKKESSLVEGELFWPEEQIQSNTEEIHLDGSKEINLLDTAIKIQADNINDERAQFKETFNTSECKEIDESKSVTNIIDIKLEKAAAEETSDINCAEKEITKASNIDENKMLKMRRKMEEMRKSMRMMEAMMEAQEEKDKENKVAGQGMGKHSGNIITTNMNKGSKEFQKMLETVIGAKATMDPNVDNAILCKDNGDEMAQKDKDPSENSDHKRNVDKEVQKKTLEIIDGNNPTEEVDLKDGVDLKAIFSFKEQDGKARQRFGMGKKGKENKDAKRQKPREDEENPEIGTHLIGTLCNYCGVVLTRDFAKHLLTHSGLRNYLCNYCSKTFILKSHLARHTRVLHHGERIPVKNIPRKLHQCEKCDFKSNLRDSLARHNVNIHKAPWPMLCIDCGKGCIRNDDLKKHSCHTAVGKARKNNSRRKCNPCDINFKVKEGLFRHNTKVHGMRKPLNCGECGKGYLRNANLMIHNRVHTGERPHICEVCARGFIDQSGLVRHKEKHKHS